MTLYELAQGEHNYHDDSDFYSIVWDDEARKVEKVMTGSTRYAGGIRALPRATEEHRQAAQDWLRPRAYLRLLRAEREDAATPAKGKRVRVVRGRKVPVGTEGVIFYWDARTYSPRFRNGYKQGPDAVKIGIATSDEKDARGYHKDAEWTYVRNVEVVDPEQYVNKRELWDRVASMTISPRGFFASGHLAFVG